ncbi:TPA: EpsG family protein [Citrobacter freundii]|nr:EpsG family protein [Citrobacter freundii]
MITLIIFSLGFYIFAYYIGTFNFNTKVQLFLTLFPLFIISAFRYNVGFDFTSYQDYFYLVQEDNDVYLDMTYKSLSRLFYDIGGNEQCIFIIYSLLTVFLLYKIFEYIVVNYDVKNRRIYIIGLVFSFYSFYFFLSLNQIRSSLSALFLCYAFIKDKRTIVFYLCFFFAFLFHSASIFLFPVYFVIKKLNFKFMLFLFPVLALLSFFNLFSELIKVLLLVSNSRFSVYFNSEFFTPKVGLEKFYTLATTFVTLVILGISILNLPRRYEMLLRLVYCFILLRLMSMDALIFARLSDFLKPVSIIIVFATIYEISFKFRPNFILPFYIIAIMILALFNIYIGSNISEIPNYKYYFNFCIFGKVCPI